MNYEVINDFQAVRVSDSSEYKITYTVGEIITSMTLERIDENRSELVSSGGRVKICNIPNGCIVEIAPPAQPFRSVSGFGSGMPFMCSGVCSTGLFYTSPSGW